MTTIRMTAAKRKEQLLNTAYAIAKAKGMTACTRRAVALKCKVSESLPNRHWASVGDMHVEVLTLAVKNKDVKLLQKAKAEDYELALIEMPRALRRELATA